MTLEEAFKIYDDSVKLIRKSVINYSPHSVGWLKRMHTYAYADAESKDLRFLYPYTYIEDVSADDWEVYKD